MIFQVILWPAGESLNYRKLSDLAFAMYTVIGGPASFGSIKSYSTQIKPIDLHVNSRWKGLRYWNIKCYFVTNYSDHHHHSIPPKPPRSRKWMDVNIVLWVVTQRWQGGGGMKKKAPCCLRRVNWKSLEQTFTFSILKLLLAVLFTLCSTRWF